MKKDKKIEMEREKDKGKRRKRGVERKEGKE
jgi:hypothetical protein